MKTRYKQLTVLTLVLATVLVAGCATSKAETVTRSSFDGITAGKTSSAPKIDGLGDDSAWKKAPVSAIELDGEGGVEPAKISLSVLYDDENIYLKAVYKDASPLKVGEAWEYDGAAWNKGAFDDSLSLVWNMDGSVGDFDAKGFDVMTTPLERGADIFDFKIADPNGSKQAYEADYWGW